MTITSREIRLKSRPDGTPIAENFEVATVTLPDLQAGEMVVRMRPDTAHGDRMPMPSARHHSSGEYG